LNGALNEAMAAATRIYAVIDETQHVGDKPGAVPIGRARGEITFDRVVFGYGPSDDVLKGLSLEALPGQTVAIVGPSVAASRPCSVCCCASTKLKAGQWRIDGKDVRELTLASLRANIAFVFAGRFPLRYDHP